MKPSLRRPILAFGFAVLTLLFSSSRAQTAVGTASAVTAPVATTAPVVAAPATIVKTHPASEVRILKSVPIESPPSSKPAISLPPKPKAHSSVSENVTGLTPPPSVVAAKKVPTGPIGPLMAPLGLPQLTPQEVGGAAPVNASKYDVDQLLPSRGAAGLKKGQQGAVNYLAIDGGRSWSRSLRGKPSDTVFVSFVVNAGSATVIKVGGAWLRLDPSSRAGYAELMAAEPGDAGAIVWEKLAYQIQLGVFGAQQFAMLPVLTVRLDPAGGVWDLFVGTRQVADNRALVVTSKSSARSFAVEAGDSGAWLCGAVVCDENPLFVDANRNGVPDDYELSRRGLLLNEAASVPARKVLAEEWRLGAPRSPPPIMRFPRPAPDRLAVAKTQP